MSIQPNPDAWIRTIDRLLEAGDYDYARDTLEGIRDWISENETVTTKQMKAINNIRRGGDRL